MTTTEERLAKIEARLEIANLAARYAFGIDSRDLELLASTYVPDVKVGPPVNGHGREALKEWFVHGASYWYRSMHLLGAHRIELDDAEHAHGMLQCRVEQEIGDEWFTVGVVYGDTYARVDGEWLFAHRRPLTIWKYSHREEPTSGFAERDGTVPFRPRLPAEYETFVPYFEQFDDEHVAALTNHPVSRRVE